MISRIGLVAGLTALGLIMGGGHALGATEVQDASCQAPIMGSHTTPFPSTARFGETFTAGHTGQLTRAVMSVLKGSGSSGDYQLDIRPVDGSGAPTETVLASTTIPNTSVPDDTSDL